MNLHISIAAEKIFDLAGFPITNSLLTTWIVMLLICGVGVFIGMSASSKSPSRIMVIFELLIGGLFNMFKEILGEKKVREFFPLLATFFIFILISNWAGLLPGLSAIGLTHESASATVPLVSSAQAATDPGNVSVPHEVDETDVSVEEEHTTEVSSTTHEEESGAHAVFTPLFRGPTADLNTTIALGLIAVGSMIFFGVKELGFAFFSRYFDFSNPIMTFVGLLEIVSDISKIISFAFRLFGNIFAGEVLLAVIGYLIPVLAPLPFLGLEIFVGLIQALVFSMLAAVFLGMATTAHGDHAHEAHA